MAPLWEGALGMLPCESQGQPLFFFLGALEAQEAGVHWSRFLQVFFCFFIAAIIFPSSLYAESEKGIVV
ncbi:MAG: hypothetical protein NTU85_03650, partial [Candidatus Kaiserbacteria bacterium]|nr:hypothetical protein [Candidatus Kaiserbacteria bacterium]